MISSLQQYKSSLVWFITGLVVAIILSWGLTPQPSVPVYQSDLTTQYMTSDFAASHLEPNFYQ
jgi:hypothetical protein